MTDSAETAPRPLVLASSSPYRAGLLDRLGLPYDQITPGIDETRHPGEAVEVYVERLARAKAEAAARIGHNAVFIGSDQACENDGEVLGKPRDVATAQRQLHAASGRTVVFHTAVAVHDPRLASSRARVVVDRVRFRVLDADTVRRYVAAERPLDCAGAFRVEGLGITLFEAVDSSDPTALIGLPLIALCGLLRQCGYRLP